jgi:hypothetical protein
MSECVSQSVMCRPLGSESNFLTYETLCSQFSGIYKQRLLSREYLLVDIYNEDVVRFLRGGNRIFTYCLQELRP